MNECTMTREKSRLLLGAHMSIAGGIQKAVIRGAAIGCTTIQIFTKNNRQWFTKKLQPEMIRAFKRVAKETNISPIVAHASYLINLGSPHPNTVTKSIQSLVDEIERCELLGIPYLVLHPGSHLSSGEKNCLKQIATNIDYVMKQTTGKVMLLLETMAGQGSGVCYTFEHIASIREMVNCKNKIGVCLDTCHVFVAGYDLRNKTNYQLLWKKFDDIIGLTHLKVIHINDSKKRLGTRVDRHEGMGKGEIGLECFRLLFNDKRFFDIPKILETPKETLEDDARNLRIIKELLSLDTQRILLNG